MRTTVLVVVSLSVASVTAAAAPPARLGAVVGGARPSDPTPRSTYRFTSGGGPRALPSALAHAAPTIIFMNKQGGIYRPGDNDARTNHSTVPGFAAQVRPWQVSDAGWQEVMSCVRDQFARMNVVVTDVDPGAVPHLESVVAGYPQDVGMGQGVGGVSPFTDDCSTIPNSIVFTFAEVYGDAYRDICETAAQEISHSFGLDHEHECRDPMTYLSGCGAKSFQDRAVPCGEYAARTCACGQASQNSVAMLIERIGAHNTPPAVGFTAPAPGATVRPGFAVAVGADDPGGAVAKVELYVDGALVDTDAAAPWAFATSATLAAGPHQLEVRAYDDADAVAAAELDVTVAVTGDGPGGDRDPADPAPDGRPEQLTGGCAVGGGGAGLALGAAVGGVIVRRRRRAVDRAHRA